jgi:branched-subunit amino acid aminotransferase/4-amino-4-deoxychorismate lyase
MNGVMINGQWITNDSMVSMISQRIWQYGDGVFESIRFTHGHSLLFPYHMARIKKGCALLGLTLPSEDDSFWREHIEKALLCSGLNQSHARVKWVIYRDSEGYFKPEHDRTSWMILVSETSPLINPLSSNKLTTVIYDTFLLPQDELSHIKTMSSIRYVLAGRYARDHRADDAFLMNTNKNICEAASHSFMIYLHNRWVTPPESEGGVASVMRSYVLDVCKLHGIQVDRVPVSKEDLINAQTILLLNAVVGIRLVEKMEHQHYFHGRETEELINVVAEW